MTTTDLIPSMPHLRVSGTADDPGADQEHDYYETNAG